MNPDLSILLAELRRRWQCGDHVAVEQLLAEHSTSVEDPEALGDLVLEEFLLRDADGGAPGLEEYVQRFPALGELLPQLIGFCHLLKPPSQGPVHGQADAPLDGRPVQQTPLTPPTEVVDTSAKDGSSGTLDGDLSAIPGYEILGELGRGGMGVVYHARQVGLNRVVALKMILNGGHAGEQALARFKVEAQAVAQLQHPNIVQIYEIGEWRPDSAGPSLPYFSLEYADGGSVAARLASTPIPPREAAALVETLAHAMQAAHEKGIVHRDLKPANVLLSQISRRQHEIGGRASELATEPWRWTEWTPKITDFGLAKQVRDANGGTALTTTGAILGTPNYMAPEQAAGRTQEIGPRTDVYALGAILYEMLTGRPPFKATTPFETIKQVLDDEPVPPARLLGPRACPRDLETICLKCLEKEPSRRYLRADDLADDLARFVAGQPIRAKRASIPERVAKWTKRRPGVAALLAVVAILTVAGVTTVLWMQQSRLSALADKVKADEGLSEALDEVQASAQQARVARNAALVRSYHSGILLAHREFLADSPDIAQQHLAECVPKPEEPDLRGWEWHYLHRLCHPQPAPMTAARHRPRHVAWSRDGKWLVTGGYDKTIRLWDANTRKEVGILGTHSARVGTVAINADASRVASVSYDLLGSAPGKKSETRPELKIWDVAGRKELFNLQGHTWPIACVVFSNDGRLLASACGDHRNLTVGEVIVWDAATGKHIRTLRCSACGFFWLVFSPDDKKLATVGADQLVRIWRVETGQEDLAMKEKATKSTNLAYSPDGKWLAACGPPDDTNGAYDAQRVHVWDSATGQLRFSLEGPGSHVQFSPDGRHLAFAHRKTIAVLDLSTRRRLFTLRGHTEMISDLAYDPNGSRLASVSTDNTVRFWAATRGQEAELLSDSVGGKYVLESLAFHPNAAWLAIVNQSTLQIWDTAGQREIAVRPCPRSRGVAFSPNGECLATIGDDGFVRIWDTQSWQELRTIRSANFSGWSNRVFPG